MKADFNLLSRSLRRAGGVSLEWSCQSWMECQSCLWGSFSGRPS